MSQTRGIIKDQLNFFNKYAAIKKSCMTAPFFMDYVNKEQTKGFVWLSDRKRILDFGCGTGTSINAFLNANPGRKNSFVGVDIADVAITRVKRSYPEYIFYTIMDNKIPLLRDKSMDGAYLLHVLHHSHEHEAILSEIYQKLREGGKFFISDLSSRNPIHKLFLKLFVSLPSFIKKKFSDDLIVEGSIPEKYKVDPDVIIAKLQKIGFSVQEIGYGHLCMFVFAWIDRFISLSRSNIFRSFFKVLWSIEDHLLKNRFFYKYAEVFFIKCIKK